MSVALKAALQARRMADVHLSRAIERDYPVGAAIRWLAASRKGACDGHVRHHAPIGDRVCVVNDRTGRVSWIRAWQIVDAMEEAA